MPEKFFKFFVIYLTDQSGIIGRHPVRIVGKCFCGTCHINPCTQPDIQTACSYHDGIGSPFCLPMFCPCIPVAESFVIKKEFHSCTFPCLQKYFLKSFQFFFRTEYLRVLFPHIKLRHFCPISASCILQRKRCAFLIYGQITVCKLCVGKAKSKGIQNSYFCGIIIAVSHIESFPVFGISLFTGEVPKCRRILIPDRIGLI